MAAAEQSIRAPLVPLWRMIRHLYPVYATISEWYQLAPPPAEALSQMEQGNNDSLFQIAAWVDEIDAATQPQHLRSVLQEQGIGCSDLSLQMWLQHFLSKPNKTAGDRDKVDFLLVQYLCLNLPPSMQEGRVNRAAIGAVLEPVIGSVCDELPPAASELNELIGITERCRCLADIERSGIISRGRELKLGAGDQYFAPVFLLAFTHFNAVVRRECQRLMNSDLKFIGESIDRLERQGITHIDCTAANWSNHEPLAVLKNKWATWELENRDGNFFASLIGFRTAVEEAVSRSVELSMSLVSQELRTIHDLLSEMRSELSELPRKLALVTMRATGNVERAPRTVPAIQKPEPIIAVQPQVQAEKPLDPGIPEFPVIAESKVVESGPEQGVIPADELEAALTPSPNAIAPKEITAAKPATEDTAEAVAQPAVNPTPAAEPAVKAAVEPTTPEPMPIAGTPDLDEGIARLQKTLCGKRPAAVSIAVAGTRVLLTGGEVAMFSDKESAGACTLQRAVMSRIFLVSALEGYGKDRDKTKLLPVAKIARAEQESLREVIATCKANKQLREEEVLAASGKQLSAMLERAERILR